MRRLGVLMGLVLAWGCGGPRLRVVDPLPAPGPSAARVILYRPAEARAGRPYPAFDGDVFLGMLEAGSRVDLLCAPGEHLFHLLGPGDPVVRAQLAGGKTYVLKAAGRPTWFRLDLVLEGADGIPGEDEAVPMAAPRELGERYLPEARERLAEYERRPGAGRLLQPHQGF